MKNLEATKRLMDLHIHSTNSDGEQSPQEVIEQAKAAGLSLISITDHNVFTLTECKQYQGMSIVPGIEFSAEYYVPAWNETTEIHIVGIFPDGVNASEFDSILANVGEGKEVYVAAILENLESRGIHITMQEVLDIKRKSKNIGRHEIAKVLVAKGVEADIEAAFDHQIGNFSPYYISSTRYIHYAPMGDIVRQIRISGGIPILAHPYGYRMNVGEIEQLISDFKRAIRENVVGKSGSVSNDLAVGGMEVYYQRYMDEADPSRFELLKILQKKYGLIASAASDHHREYQPFCSGGDIRLFEDMVLVLRAGKV